MKKIPTLFERNYDGDRLVRNEVTPGCEWVINGEGIPTQKYDGTCCLMRDGVLYKRYDAKRGRTPPEGFEAAQEADPLTGHQPGWLPVTEEDRWHQEAWLNELHFGSLPNGTYELVGPKVQGNPEGFIRHVFKRHGSKVLSDCPRDFEGLKAYLAEHDIEGIVWWRDINAQDCEKIKLKKRDFGFKR